MDASTQNIVVAVAGIAIILAVGITGIVLIYGFMQRLQKGKGPMGEVFQRAKETSGMAKEALQSNRESLAAHKETNELLKQIIARLDKRD